jgi:hypothetical protein
MWLNEYSTNGTVKIFYFSLNSRPTAQQRQTTMKQNQFAKRLPNSVMY